MSKQMGEHDARAARDRVETLLGADERRRSAHASAGAGLGATLGSLIGGYRGAALGAALLGGLAVFLGERRQRAEDER